jgi:hypothetical protein
MTKRSEKLHPVEEPWFTRDKQLLVACSLLREAHVHLERGSALSIEVQNFLLVTWDGGVEPPRESGG